ncbi:helix-turn-helix domain-containing protein [Granulicella cerasi]|uniref:Helix-turn-helix domain-containing protein n=1 Tax=Granulicella cerasi TaxID=741063 RepID=A0ABW1ZBX6_9BACT|nr:DNA-binding transcriptional regulator [Granulicella cerasi]
MKTKTEKYKSKRLGVAHRLAKDLDSVGMIDKWTMRELDVRALTPVKPLSPAKIVSIRRREKASQAVFASMLGVTVSLVSQWERGEKKPSGPSLKLLTLVAKNGLDWVA